MWGEQDSVPVYEFKNSSFTFPGSVSPDLWGFNLDGEGDFFAVSDDTATITYGAPWRTHFVVDGPKMRRFDKGYFSEDVVEHGFRIRTSKPWASNELSGCFVRLYSDEEDWYWSSQAKNACRRIEGNTASTPDSAYPGYYTFTVYPDGAWRDLPGYNNSKPRRDEKLVIRPWPEHFLSPGWTNLVERGYGYQGINYEETGYAAFGMLADLNPGESYRRTSDGYAMRFTHYTGEDTQNWEWYTANTWVKDRTPQPGPSGIYDNEDHPGEIELALPVYLNLP